jgi:hypothetical protein
MKSQTILFGLAAFALLLSAGCETVDTRIKEKPDVFAKLDAATQAKIKQGIIDLGYTEDMVYLALGAPDEKRESRSEAGTRIIWIYSRYYERYEGTSHVGYYRDVYFDPRLRAYRVYYQPVLREVYSPHRDERIRIVFKEGRAAVIEQTKDY